MIAYKVDWFLLLPLQTDNFNRINFNKWFFLKKFHWKSIKHDSLKSLDDAYCVWSVFSAHSVYHKNVLCFNFFIKKMHYICCMSPTQGLMPILSEYLQLFWVAIWVTKENPIAICVLHPHYSGKKELTP